VMGLILSSARRALIFVIFSPRGAVVEGVCGVVQGGMCL